VKPAEFHPLANQEFAETVRFYDQRSANLGDAFASAVEAAIGFVRANPAAGTLVRRNVRRWMVRRFPYFVIYREEPNRLYVLALAHQRRLPEYWADRI